MSLVTRLLGFVSCLVGAYLASYGLALHAAADNISGQVNTYVNIQGVAPGPAFFQAVLAEIASYIQQNVTPVWTYYLVVGIAMVIFGSVLVVIGDRKPSSAR